MAGAQGVGLEQVRDIFDRLEPQSEGQQRLKEALRSGRDLVGVFGPTGTGKSLFATAYALSALARGEYKRVIVSRPIVDVVSGKELTLIGSSGEYTRLASEYLRDILGGYADPRLLDALMGEGRLVLADPHFLRGRTFDESVIILDDAQSVPPETIVEVITRLGRDSRLIIAGDPVFQRTEEVGRDGASMAREILAGEESAVVVDLGVKDIVRPGAKRGIKFLLELQMRKRRLNDTERAVIDSARLHAPDADVITVVDLQEAKRRWGIESEHTPDALIVVKEGHLGRLIGSGGERIAAIEEDTGLRLRAIQHTLDFREVIRAVHPVSWVHKHVIDVDFAGPQLRILVSRDAIGPMLGQRGVHIKFLDEVFRSLVGVGVYAVEAEEAPRRQARRRRR
ncbi:MAG: PhoH family protein [Desulfurococcales archaeon]|nr:PhoH family protein [Desulfurococcales archaeon]